MQDLSKTLSKLNVLVVDDMEAIRSMVKACLRNMGIENVSTAINGEYAWKGLQTRKIDLIVSDWDMPKLTGVEFLKLVRNSNEHKHIPFLMLTATSDKSRVVNAIHAGTSDYLTKPFQPKELEYRVIKLVAKHFS